MNVECTLNPQEGNIWEGIVAQCEDGGYSTINVASVKRRQVILKVNQMVRGACIQGIIGESEHGRT